TMGSPNPMLSGVALSRRTAERLVLPASVAKGDAGFEHLFDGTERTFQRWRAGGPGSFALVHGPPISPPGRHSKVDGVTVPVGADSVFYYPAEAFNDFTLRLQFRLSGPIGSTGKPIDNSGIFLRFHAPHSKGPDLPTNGDSALQQNVADDAAW